MSGFHTHMLIGAVGGLTAFKVIDHLAPAKVYLPLTVVGRTYVVPPAAIGIGVVVASAYLALWPDIDEPGTHVSNQVLHYMWLLGGVIGMLAMLALSYSAVSILAGALQGAALGLVGGWPGLAILRLISGGHRRLTHSLVVGTALFMLGVFAYTIGMLPLALPAFALAWGQALHLAGDIETRSGIPLFYPFGRHDYHLFPYGVARFGELIAAVTALAVGVVLVWWR